MTLITKPNLVDPDAVYERIIALHEGRSDEDSERINARLILLLANHIGDQDTIFEAITLAGKEKAS
ncbi:DUF2783 domain-containing protein [Novosphingobium sp.]|uniref:DUF2783 domain-containing protein n=1 Tax=Novosphingobium sp. TaxID=1874826 RepID=UPI002B49842F|nr:DUF2783 domain-containing protein [Novosphingobium sp.]HKR93170.1 DUF2783 domain-containing protein [Novosphingobium sp.]